MKLNTFILAACAIGVLPALLSAEKQTWTNSDGQTMEAAIVDVRDDIVVFDRGDRTFNYPIANLADEDQRRIRDWTRENEERLRKEEAQRAVSQTLQGNLVRLQGSRLTDYPRQDLEGKRLFAFYYSASWCGPCRRFTPDLVDFYNRVQRTHPEFELIFVSSDNDVRAMQDYMREYRMQFPAIRYNRRNNIDVVNAGRERGIPNLVFVDGSGEVLSRSYVNGRYLGPRSVLRDIERHLNN